MTWARWSVVPLALLLISAAANLPATRVRGTVRDAETGAPVHARIELNGQSVQADAQGAFVVERLAPGAGALKASAPGYQPLDRRLTLGGRETSLFLPLTPTPKVGTIQGTLALRNPNASIPMPIPEVPIQVVGGPVVHSGGDGAFTVSAVGPGPVTLRIQVPGLKPVEEVVVVPPNGTASVELKLDLLGAPTLASFRGRVRSSSGRAVEATVRVPEAKLKVETDREGNFELRLPGGRYTVTFEAAGHLSQTKLIEVGSGDQALFYVDLSPSER